MQICENPSPDPFPESWDHSDIKCLSHVRDTKDDDSQKNAIQGCRGCESRQGPYSSMFNLCADWAVWFFEKWCMILRGLAARFDMSLASMISNDYDSG